MGPRELRDRLQTDLLAARKGRRQVEVSAIRSLLSALANAEAVPVTDGPVTIVEGSADVPRQRLSEADVEAVVRSEIAERRRALAIYADRGSERADLDLEVALLERYLQDR